MTHSIGVNDKALVFQGLFHFLFHYRVGKVIVNGIRVFSYFIKVKHGCVKQEKASGFIMENCVTERMYSGWNRTAAEWNAAAFGSPPLYYQEEKCLN